MINLQKYSSRIAILVENPSTTSKALEQIVGNVGYEA